MRSIYHSCAYVLYNATNSLSLPLYPLAMNSAIPSSPPSPTLRLGTFNVGRGFIRQLPTLLHRSSSLCLDAVAVQEIGDPALFQRQLNSYRLVFAPGPSDQQAGVGLFL